MARDRRAACRSRRDLRRVADGSANLSRHTFAPSQEERRVAEATARGRLSRLQLARRRLATGVAGRQSRSLADRDHASKQGRHPRRGRLHESLRQRSSKHFLPHRLRSQNPEIRGTLTDPRHRALSGRQTAQSGCSQVFREGPSSLHPPGPFRRRRRNTRTGLLETIPQEVREIAGPAGWSAWGPKLQFRPLVAFLRPADLHAKQPRDSPSFGGGGIPALCASGSRRPRSCPTSRVLRRSPGRAASALCSGRRRVGRARTHDSGWFVVAVDRRSPITGSRSSNPLQARAPVLGRGVRWERLLAQAERAESACSRAAFGYPARRLRPCGRGASAGDDLLPRVSVNR